MSKASLLHPLPIRELKLRVSYKTIYTGSIRRYGAQGLL
jgi:hypothetical protein